MTTIDLTNYNALVNDDGSNTTGTLATKSALLLTPVLTPVQTAVTALDAVDATKAPLASPSFTGTVTAAGLLDLSGASAGQVKFPATQNASADANTLDDYEEGTWTAIDGSGASLSFTTTHTALYTKIGRVVFVSFAIVYPATASGAGAIVGGLPFTSGGGGGQQYALLTVFTDYGAGMLNFVAAGGTTIAFYTMAAVQITNANLSGKIVRCTGWYFV